MFRNIKAKFVLHIVPYVVITLFCIYIAIIGVSIKLVRDETTQKIEANKREQATRIEDSVLQIQRTVGDLAINISHTYTHTSLDDYTEILLETAESKDYLLGLGIWFAPYAYDENEKYASRYVMEFDGHMQQVRQYETAEYDYFTSNFYSLAEESKTIAFTQANYDDAVTGLYMISCIAPIFDENDNFIGCVAADFEITKLQQLVEEYNSDEINFYILDNTGVYLGDSDLSLVRQQANILDTDIEGLEKVANQIIDNDRGTITYYFEGDKYLLYYDTISDFDWKLIYETSLSDINQPIYVMSLIYLLICIIALFILVLSILYNINTIIYRPIYLLLDEFKSISDNNYSVNIPKELLDTKDEFSIIGNSLSGMKVNLKQFQNDLEDKNQLLVERERTLQEVIKYNKAIINALPDILIILTNDGYITEYQCAKGILDIPDEFFMGYHASEIIDKNDWLKIKDVIKNMREGDDVYSFEFSYYINDKLEHFMANVAYCRENEIIALCHVTTKIYEQMDEIKKLNYFDQVTGLSNRKYYEELLYECVRKEMFPLSVIFSDINGLKLINHSFGLKYGNRMLVKFAEVLKSVNIDRKYVSRIDGDDFAIILPNTDNQTARNIINDLVIKFFNEEINGIQLSASFGCGTMYSKDEELKTMIKSAEDEMFQQKIYESSSRKDSTIEVINKTLQAKNPREQLHSNRVADLCERTAICLGMSKSEQSKLRTAGLLHDIGKIGVPENILNKPSKLTEEENKIIRKHPETGYRILDASGNMKELSECVLSHHEKWDGTGYPRGIKGEDIPLEARIIAIADTYDAITSERSYRKGLSKEFAIEELIRCKGSQFDPKLIDIFVEQVLKKV